MEQIEQLKAMRDAARERIQALPDYQLMTKLSIVIAELEESFGIVSTDGDEEAPAGDAEDGQPLEVEAIDDIGEIDEIDEIEDIGEIELVEDEPEEEAAEEEPVEDVEAALSQIVSEAREESGAGEEAQASEASDEVSQQEADEDEAIRQAMEELEADLENVKL
ncbi:MAG: hypothetical protein WBO55_00645 [Rhizobiaceae bacterium]